MVKPIHVKALPQYRIHVLFEDNTEGVIDLSSFISEGIFASLKDENVFSKVYVSKSAIAWSEELEIDSAAIYSEIKQRTPEELFHSFTSYAAD